MRKHFATGVVILLPLALTFWIVSFIIDILTQPFLGIADSALSAIGLKNVTFFFFSTDQIVDFASQVLILLFLFGAIIGIGAVGRYFFFKYILKLGDSILHKIPLVSSVYKTTQELIQTILTSTNKSFKQVVLVNFPHSESWVIGLVTRDEFELENRVAVFVPTTPNPTSGFLVMYKKEQIIPLDMKVEEALRFVISCGILLTPFHRLEDFSESKNTSA